MRLLQYCFTFSISLGRQTIGDISVVTRFVRQDLIDLWCQDVRQVADTADYFATDTNDTVNYDVCAFFNVTHVCSYIRLCTLATCHLSKGKELCGNPKMDYALICIESPEEM